jgi:hypothetical protein
LNSTTVSQTAREPRELLSQVRLTVLETINRLPKYVCTQTIDRQRYEPGDPNYFSQTRRRSCDDIAAMAKRALGRRRLSSSDRLRLDVAVSHGLTGIESELYSWAGEDKFGGRDLFDFVRDGAVATGSFAGMLTSIFGGSTASFSYNGDSKTEGQLLSEFSFRVAQERSRYLYVLGNGPGSVMPIAYDGVALIDPATSDLVKLSIRASQLPSETGVCELAQRLDYHRVRLDGGEFLLPAEANIAVIHVDGSEAENRIQYSGCREFRSDSKIHFAQAESGAPPNEEPTSPPLVLPDGLPFKVVFTDPIDTVTAAAGDAIRGRLKTAIRAASSSKVLVPQGSSVGVRVLKIKRLYGLSPSASERGKSHAGQPELVMEVALETLELHGKTFPFHASFDSDLQRFGREGPLGLRIDLGTLDGNDDSSSHAGVGTFQFREAGPKFVVKSGLESNWVTGLR